MKQHNAKKTKNFQKSLTRVMFEWAREQPEFEINLQNLREEKFRNEDDLEKFAFFQMFEKVKRYFSDYSLTLNTIGYDFFGHYFYNYLSLKFNFSAMPSTGLRKRGSVNCE